MLATLSSLRPALIAWWSRLVDTWHPRLNVNPLRRWILARPPREQRFLERLIALLIAALIWAPILGCLGWLSACGTVRSELPPEPLARWPPIPATLMAPPADPIPLIPSPAASR